MKWTTRHWYREQKNTERSFDTLIGEFDMARELLTKLDFPEELVLNRSAEEVKKYLKK